MTEEGFLMDLRRAELFFRICRRYGVEGREPRIALIRELTRRGKAKYLRDVTGFVKGKTALRITKRSRANES